MPCSRIWPKMSVLSASPIIPLISSAKDFLWRAKSAPLISVEARFGRQDAVDEPVVVEQENQR